MPTWAVERQRQGIAIGDPSLPLLYTDQLSTKKVRTHSLSSISHYGDRFLVATSTTTTTTTRLLYYTYVQGRHRDEALAESIAH